MKSVSHDHPFEATFLLDVVHSTYFVDSYDLEHNVNMIGYIFLNNKTYVNMSMTKQSDANGIFILPFLPFQID